MTSISVFCGSSPGNSNVYKEYANLLAKYIAKNGFTLIYGGGKVGLMGEIADAALAEGGKVVGVIPKHLEDKEVGHTGLTELHVVESMHQRKKLIEELSDAFIALPGGLGTTEEIFEMLTWAQLSLHKKPCAFLNINNYFNPLIGFMDSMVNEGFLEQEYRDMIIIEENIETIFEKFQNYNHPIIDKARKALSKM